MKIKLTEKYWAENFKDRSKRIKDWIDQGAVITEGENTPQKNLFDEYLRGTDIAGIGQGKFSNNAKENVYNGWKEISELLKNVKNTEVPNQENQQTDNSPTEDNNKNKELFERYKGLFSSCEKLQKNLTECCKKSKKEGEETKEVEEHVRQDFPYIQIEEY